MFGKKLACIICRGNDSTPEVVRFVCISPGYSRATPVIGYHDDKVESSSRHSCLSASGRMREARWRDLVKFMRSDGGDWVVEINRSLRCPLPHTLPTSQPTLSHVCLRHRLITANLSQARRCKVSAPLWQLPADWMV